jgi:hypothetical protein
MGSKSDAFEIDVLKAATGQATTILTTTPLATVNLRLYTTAPSDSTGGAEVVGGGYAPVNTVGKWGVPTAGNPTQVSNNAVVTFPAATADWGTIVACSIGTGGNQMYWGALTTPKAVNNGDVPSFAVGQLIITED